MSGQAKRLTLRHHQNNAGLYDPVVVEVEAVGFDEADRRRHMGASSPSTIYPVPQLLWGRRWRESPNSGRRTGLIPTSVT
jgi:hypothetical protein